MRRASLPGLRTVLAVAIVALSSLAGMWPASADNSVTYTYDPVGRVTGMQDADGQTTTYQYDVNGNLQTQAVSIASIEQTQVPVAPGQVAQMQFTGSVGQQIRLATEWDSNLNAAPYETIKIVEPDGQTLLYDNAHYPYQGTMYDLSGVLTLPSNGTYSIQVTFGSAVSGNLNFYVSPVLVAPTAVGAQPIAINTSLPGQVASLTFGGTAGQQVRLATQWDNGIGGDSSTFGARQQEVVLFAPDGTPVYDNTTNYAFGQFPGAGYDLSGLLTLPATGTYQAYLLSGGLVYGQVTINVSAPLTSAVAVNDSPTVLPTTVPGQLASLTFSGTVGQQLRLATQWDGGIGGGSSPFGVTQQEIVLIAPNGTRVYDNTINYAFGRFPGAGYDLSGLLTLTAAGTYQAYLLSGGPVYGTVTMNVSAPQASAVAVNDSPTALRTTLPGQPATLSFSGTLNQQLRLVTQWDGGIGGGSSSLGVRDQEILLIAPDGTLVFNNTINYAFGPFPGPGSDLSGVLTLPATGTYEAVMLPGGPVYGVITMNVPGEVIFAEPPVNQSVSVTLGEPGQSAEMTFAGGPGNPFRLVTRWQWAQGEASTESISIVAPDGQTQFYGQATYTPTTGGSDISPELNLTQSGTYRIELLPGDPVDGTVSFDLSQPKLVNSPIVPDGGYVGTTTALAGQVVVGTIAGTAGQSINLSTQWDSNIAQSSTVAVTVIAPDGQSQLYNVTDAGSAGQDTSTTLALATTGNYTVRFVPSGAVSGNVQFSAATVVEVGPLAIVNPSFEANQLSVGAYVVAANGWNLANLSSGSTYRPGPAQDPNGVPDGVNVFNITSGSVSQQLAATVQPNTTYALQVYVGARADYPMNGYAVTLQAGGSTLAADNNTLTPAPGAFLPSTVNYYASAGDPNIGQPLTIVLTGGTGAAQVNFDLVSLTATAGNTLSPPAELGPLAIVNPSFEAVSLSPGGVAQNNILGWTANSCACGTFRPGSAQFPNGPSDGVNVGFLNSGSFSQQLQATIQPNTTYTLQVDVGARADYTYGGYLVTLQAGETVLASDTNQLDPSSPGSFLTSTVSYYASAADPNIGQPLMITLGAGPNGYQADYDNVRLTATTGNNVSPPPQIAELGALAIVNPSFEWISLSSGANTNGTIPGWNASNCSCGTFSPSPAAFANGPTNGVNTAFAQSGSFSQQIQATIQPNTTYTLQVDVGARADYPYGGYVVSLQAGTATLAVDNNTLTPIAGGFVTSILSYYASPTDPNIGLPLTLVLGTGPSYQANFDNIRLNATVGGS